MMSQEEIKRELAAIYGEARGLGSGCEGSSSPPDLGGLGIVDLQKFGFALRMRWLWLRRVDPSRPWFCLPDEKEGVVELMFQASIYVVLGDGNAALFWSDRWLDGQSLMDIAPCLCNAVGPRIRSKRTVAQALQGGQWIRDITGALTVQVLLEYLQIWDRLGAIQLGQQPDKICWRWSSDRIFSTASAYRAFFIGQHPIAGAKLIYKTRAPAKCNFFAWLALHDRCWMAHRRKRHNLQDNDDCTLCSQFTRDDRSSSDQLLIYKGGLVQDFSQVGVALPRSRRRHHFACRLVAGSSETNPQGRAQMF